VKRDLGFGREGEAVVDGGMNVVKHI
jgi:hypothetical protein